MSLEMNMKFWLENNYNVIFRGRHGVGKTAIITSLFDNFGLKWIYFSASTMDPWVDFIGIPKERVDENGNSYLDLVRPKHFQDDEIEAIYLDEFNRSSKKVRNAVMELIQFKSINGKKFNNLRVIWTAINPEENDEYDVEKLDPAQMDRFHVVVDLPYKPSLSFLKDKYGVEWAKASIEWWNKLSDENKLLVSPRRLDYALEVAQKEGDVKYVLPNSVNVQKLTFSLKEGDLKKNIRNIVNNYDIESAKSIVNNTNKFDLYKDIIFSNKEYINYFVSVIPDEQLVPIVASNKKLLNFVLSNSNKYKNVLTSLSTYKVKSVANEAQKALTYLNSNKMFDEKILKDKIESGQYEFYYNQTNKTNTDSFFHKKHSFIRSFLLNSNSRRNTYERLKEYLPNNLTKKEVSNNKDWANEVNFMLNVVAQILLRSQDSTIRRSYYDSVMVINQLIRLAYSASIVNKIPNETKKLLTVDVPDKIKVTNDKYILS